MSAGEQLAVTSPPSLNQLLSERAIAAAADARLQDHSSQQSPPDQQ